jgi:hypothetical protein
VKSELSAIPEVSVANSGSQTSGTMKTRVSDNDLTLVSALPDQSIVWDSGELTGFFALNLFFTGFQR